MTKLQFGFALLLTLASGCLGAQTGLPDSVEAMLRNSNIPAAHLGVVAIRASDGAVVLSHQPTFPMQPASTLKVLTAIVALDQFGPAHRSLTEVRTAAPVANGVLQGDLVLRGLGNVDFDWQALKKALQTVRDAGIRRIEGDLVIDREYFQPPRTDVGVAPFDEAPEFRYNVIPDALMVNTNLLEFTLRADQAGVDARIQPALDGVAVVSEMKLVERACEKWEEGWRHPRVVVSDLGQTTIYLQGDYPRDCHTTTQINVLERTLYTERLFRALWRELGGEFSGRVREASAPGGRVLATARSRTLAEMLRDVNKRSDNPITRAVFLSLGAAAGTPGPTAAKSEAVVFDWMRRAGISTDQLVLDNGSGLSRSARIQPLQLAQALRAAAASHWAPEFMASLPIVGIDGAMANRLGSSPAIRAGRFKTGGLNNVASVAGYVPDATGQLCIVVAIINHPPPPGGLGRVARPVLDAVIDWVARSQPSPANPAD